MAKFKRMLAFILVLTIIASFGEGFAFAVEGETAEEEQLAPPVAGETTEETPLPETTQEPAATAEPEQTDEPEQSAAPDVPTEDKPGSVPPPSAGGMLPVIPAPVVETPAPSENPEEGEEPEETEHKQWPWTEPGNEVAALLSGGTSLLNGGSFYYVENGLWLEQGGSDTCIANVNAGNLNLSGGWLYYTANNAVYRMSPTGGNAETVYSAESSISQMYVMGDEIRFVASSSAFSYDMRDGVLETLTAPDGVSKLIPTPYGNLYLTGTVYNYTLWAETTMLHSGIESCYPDGEWLVIYQAGETLQTSLSALFDGSLTLQAYNLHQDEIVADNGLSEDEQLANEAAYLSSDAYMALQEPLEEVTNGGIMTMSTSQAQTAPLSTNQQNIILRAQQMAYVRWTAKKSIYAWGGDDKSYLTTRGDNYIMDVNKTKSTGSDAGKFVAGRTYMGVPYSQAVSTGYVGFNITLAAFLSNTQNANSVFYSSYSTYSRTAPYYGSDCSGFVSYAWDLPYRCTCSGIVQFATRINSTSSTFLNNVQIGDILDNTGSHVVLITDIARDQNNKVISVEVTEQTPSKMRVTCYGELISGKQYVYTGGLKDIQNYLNQGYVHYRRNYKGAVGRPSDDAQLNYAAAPTMKLAVAGPGALTVTLSHATSGAKIYYTIDGTAPSAASKYLYSSPFKVSTSNAKSGEVTVRAIVTVPNNSNSFPLNETLKVSDSPVLSVVGGTSSDAFKNGSTYYVENGKKVTLTAASGATIYYTTNGSEPTTSSSKVTSSTAITVPDSGVTVKAFAVTNSSSIPSNTVTFEVKTGAMHTVTINDAFGFIVPTNGTVVNGAIKVLDGSDVSFTINSRLNPQVSGARGYTLSYIMLDGAKLSQTSGTYKLSNVKENHTIKAVAAVPCSDVDLTNDKLWYKDAIVFAYCNDLFAGTSTDSKGNFKFSPSDPMTRAMFVTVLGRYAQPSMTVSGQTLDTTAKWQAFTSHIGVTRGEDVSYRSTTTTSSGYISTLGASGQYFKVLNTSIKGVDGGKWYQIQYNSSASAKAYVRAVMPSTGKTIFDVCAFTDLSSKSVSYANGFAQWANMAGIINGESTTKLGSNNKITRQDICVMMYNYLTKYLGVKVSTARTQTFSDSGKIASYAVNAVNAMVNIGVIQGTGTQIQPNAYANRAQVAIMFMRLDEYLNG